MTFKEILRTTGERVRDVDERRAGYLQLARRWWVSVPRVGRIGVAVVGIVLLFALPNLYIPGVPFRTDEVSGGNSFGFVLSTIAIYVLVAIGLNVVIGLAGLLDLGYIGFFAVGAYSVALFGSKESVVATKYPWLICIPIAIALAMVSGVILGTPTLRLRGDYLAIVTLGFGEIVRLIAVNSSVTNGTSGIGDVPVPSGKWPAGTEFEGEPLFGVNDSRPFYWLTLVLIVLVVWMVRRLERSRVGRSWLALREDEDAASLMGVATFKFKLWAFAIGAGIGGLSGGMFASRNGHFGSNSITLLLSIMFVAAVVLGGQGNILGVSMGTVLAFYLPERFRAFEQYRDLIFGLALILIMVLRPQGLFPSRRRAKELEDRKIEAKEAVISV